MTRKILFQRARAHNSELGIYDQGVRDDYIKSILLASHESIG